MLSKGTKSVQWIEHYCRQPEGQHVGEFIYLLPFQTDAIYAVYNGNDFPIPPDAEAGILAAVITEQDRAALTLAVERCQAESAERARQVERMLADRPWAIVATFASFSCQCRALHLKPYETPPCHCNNPDKPGPNYEDAARLQRRMLKAGVSKWHPDPLAAIAAGKRRRGKAR
jgi:hypothetical protein